MGRRSVVVNCRDVTERKQAENSLCFRREKKPTATPSLFFYGIPRVPHPLSTILVSAQLLQNSHDECPKEKRQRNVQRIEAAAKNMTHLLDDILTINRAETSKLEFNQKLLI